MKAMSYYRCGTDTLGHSRRLVFVSTLPRPDLTHQSINHAASHPLTSTVGQVQHISSQTQQCRSESGWHSLAACSPLVGWCTWSPSHACATGTSTAADQALHLPPPPRVRVASPICFSQGSPLSVVFILQRPMPKVPPTRCLPLIITGLLHFPGYLP
jgi:hypothetical protein